MKRMKQLTALMLVITMLTQLIPAALANENVPTGHAEIVYVDNVPTMRDQVIDGNLRLTDKRDTTVDGVIDFTSGGKMIITSGSHTISRDAVIKGDILISGAAWVMIDGIVEGDIYIECPPWDENNFRWNNDHYMQGVDINIGEHAVIRKIHSGAMMGSIQIAGGSIQEISIISDLPEGFPECRDIALHGNAFVNKVALRGKGVPTLGVYDNALVSYVSVDDSASFYQEGGYINEAYITDGSIGTIQFAGHTGTLHTTGLHSRFYMHGGRVDELVVENVRPKEVGIYPVTEDGVWISKGSSLGTVHVGNRGGICISNIHLTNPDDYIGVPFDQMDLDAVSEETYIEKLYIESGAKMDSTGHIGELHASGECALQLAGRIDRLYADRTIPIVLGDHDPFVAAPGNGQVETLVNQYLYQGRAIEFAHLVDSTISVSYGVELGTLIMDGGTLRVNQFHHIDNLILRNVHLERWDFTERYNAYFKDRDHATVDTLLMSGSNTVRDNLTTEQLWQVTNASVYGGSSPALFDVQKLYLPAGSESYNSVLYTAVRHPAEGLRAEAEAIYALPEEERPELEPGQQYFAPDESCYIAQTAELSTSRKGGQITESSITSKKPTVLTKNENEIRKSTSKDHWYSLETKPLESVEIMLDAHEGLGVLTVFAPDGQVTSLVSAEEASETFRAISREGGAYKLRLSGAPNDYTLHTQITQPVRVALDAQFKPVSANGKAKTSALDLTQVDVTVENLTRGTIVDCVTTANEVAVTTDLASAGDKLRLTLTSPEDEFITAQAEVTISKKNEAAAEVMVYEYGSYLASCVNSTDVSMHLYDGEGRYLFTLPSYSGVYTADHLLPGDYQLVMIRGEVGRWHFPLLSDYAEFGLQDGRDFRLDRFTLKPGYVDNYPSATIPEEPIIDSPYVVESASRFDSAQSSCLVGQRVLMYVEYELEQAKEMTEAYVDIQLSNGMTVHSDEVTLNGQVTPAQLNDRVLRIPISGTSSGKIAFYAFDGGVQEEMLSIARLTAIENGQTHFAYLGFSVVEMKQLTISGSRLSSGTVNLYGYGVPGESITILHNGVRAGTALCDANGKWRRTLQVEATNLYTDHVFSASLYSGTSEELVSPKSATVRVHNSLPALEGLTLYYYEHEYLRKLELSAEEFYQGKLRYNYLPGAEYTFTFRFSNAERLEGLWLVRETQRGEKLRLRCTYNPTTDEWTVSGNFPYTALKNKLVLEYDLAPLPEPDAFSQAEIDSIINATIGRKWETAFVNTHVTDDFEVESTVLFKENGKEIFRTDMQISLDTEAEMNLDTLEERAIAEYTADDGSKVYVLGSYQKPQSIQLFIVSPEDYEAYIMQIKTNSTHSSFGNMFNAAQADTFDTLYNSAVQIYSAGAIITATLLSGAITTAIDIWTYNVQMVRLLNLHNSILTDLEVGLIDKAAAATTYERWRCLDLLATRCMNLRSNIKDTINKYSKQAIRDGIIELLTAKLGKILPEILGELKVLRRSQNAAKDALHAFTKQIDELTAKISDLKTNLPKNADELITASKNQWDDFVAGSMKDFENYVNDIKKLPDIPAELVEKVSKLNKRVSDVFAHWSNVNDYVNNGINDAFTKSLTVKSGEEYFQSQKKIYEAFQRDAKDTLILELAEIASEYIGLGLDLQGPLTALEQLKEKIIESKPHDVLKSLEKDLTKLFSMENELEKAQKEKKGKEELIAELIRKLVNLMTFQQKVIDNVINETINQVCNDFSEKFLKDYNAFKAEYDLLKSLADECPPDEEDEEEDEDEDEDEEEDEEEEDGENEDNDNGGEEGTEGEDESYPDPSGYVYEGVWSNRISDVTVTAYQRTNAGRSVQWDAEDYGQQNPQLTDAMGYYEWYVPDGMWKVTYEKDGYESAESVWLPVPPPQTEVHQNIISYEAPEVEYAIHYGDYVEIAFTKPMQLSSITPDSVAIGYDYTAEPVDAERDGASATILASKFRLFSESNLRNRLNISVNGNALSYAGVGAVEASLICNIQKPLESLYVPASIKLKTGETFRLPVKAEGGDFDRYTIVTEGLHDDLVQITGISGFNTHGESIVELLAVSPCTLNLKLSIADTDIHATVKITVTP